MAKKIMVKCPYCEQTFDRNDPMIKFVKVGRRYAHQSCAIQHEASMTQEEKDMREFFEYAKHLFGSDYNYMTTKKLAEQYHKEHGFTYSGMLSSLKWFYVITGHPIEKANGSIGIIPYIYNDAKKYFYNLYLAQQKNKEVVDYKITVEEITIPPPKIIETKPKLWFDDEED